MTPRTIWGRCLRMAPVRFVFTGVVATLTHTAVVLVLMRRFDWPAGSANFAAFVLATLVSYGLNSLWTFNAAMTRKNAVRFALVATFCAALAALLADSAARSGYGPLTGIALVVLVTTPVSFLLHRYWTYRTP